MEKPHVVQRDGESYGLGRHPLKRDDRDWMIGDVPFERRRTLQASNRRFWKMVSAEMRINQGPEGTCVGHGCTNVLMAAPSEHPTFPAFSTPDTAHTYARKLYLDASGDTTYQEGTYTRLALDVLRARGTIGAYYRMANVDDVIDTLIYTGPITFGSYWYDSMFDTHAEFNNEYIRVDTGSGIAGGHLYCLTGIDLVPESGSPPYVRMENSWGPNWGKNGTARITVDDLAVLFDGDAFLLAEEPF